MSPESSQSPQARRPRPESLMMSYRYDPRLSEGALKCPIFQTSTFVFENAEAAERMRMGVTPGMVRLSVGVEHFEDIVDDVRQALER